MDRNISKALKRKRDAERRLELTSSSPVFVDAGAGSTYITNEQVVNNFETVNNNFETVNNDITNINQVVNHINNYVRRYDLLTNGDPVNPSLLFSPQGDVIWVEV